jgi:hypothetical protein
MLKTLRSQQLLRLKSLKADITKVFLSFFYPRLQWAGIFLSVERS